MPALSKLGFKTAIGVLIIEIAVAYHISILGNLSVMGVHADTRLLGWATMAPFGSCVEGDRTKRSPPRARSIRRLHHRRAGHDTVSLLGFAFEASKDTTIRANYDGVFSSSQQNHTASDARSEGERTYS